MQRTHKKTWISPKQFQLMLDNYTAKLKVSKSQSQLPLWNIVESVIEAAQFHPDEHCRNLCKSTLKTWIEDKDIGPRVNLDKQKVLGKEIQPKEKKETEPVKTLTPEKLKTMVSAHRKQKPS